MAYIGRIPALGNFRKLDDISDQFDGVETEFEVEVDGVSANIFNIRQCICSLNGAIQEPGTAITIGSTPSSIVFSEAPEAGDTFWCIIIGDALDTATVSDGMISTSKIADDAVTTAKIPDSAITTAKIATNAVTTAKIPDSAITNAKIADTAVTVQKIENSAVSTDKIANSAVTFTKLNSAIIASQSEAEAGTESDVLMTPERTSQAITALNPFGNALLHIQDQRATGTNGGTLNNDVWQTRTLNTVVLNEITGASLSTNQITLPAGTYYIMAKGFATGGDGIRHRLRNVTDSTDTILGLADWSNSASGSTAYSAVWAPLNGRFTIAGTKTFEFQVYANSARVSSGLGFDTGDGFSLIYADVQIFKLA